MFDRAVVISLVRRPDRLEELRERPLPSCVPPLQVYVAHDPTEAPPRYSLGQWGCWVSHRNVLLTALSQGVGSLLVLEDDVRFEDCFCEEMDALATLSWDILMLGDMPDGTPPLRRPDGRLRGTYPFRTHAYAVRERGMRALTSRLAFQTGPLDLAFGQVYRRVRTCVPSRPVTSQSGSRSDIT